MSSIFNISINSIPGNHFRRRTLTSAVLRFVFKAALEMCCSYLQEVSFYQVWNMDTGDGIFVQQDGRGSYRLICVQLSAKNIFTMLRGELNSTKIMASAYNKDIQNTWH